MEKSRSPNILWKSDTGSIAVEFALIAPLFLLLVFGLVAFAIVFSIASGVQQLASEAARASVAGLSDTERTKLAQDFVAVHVVSYPFVVPQRLTVSTASMVTPSAAFQVSLTYDLTSQTAVFGRLLPFLPGQFRRDAVVFVSTSM